MIELVTRHHHI